MRWGSYHRGEGQASTWTVRPLPLSGEVPRAFLVALEAEEEDRNSSLVFHLPITALIDVPYKRFRQYKNSHIG